MQKIDMTYLMKTAIPDSEYEARVKQQEEQEEKARIQKLVYLTNENIKAPAHFTLEKYIGKRPEIRPANYFISGKPNTGKTHLACSIARELARLGLGWTTRVKEINFVNVLQLYRGYDTTVFRSLKSDAIQAPFLLWDDLARCEQDNRQANDQIFEVFEERAEKKRFNIVTCQYTLNEVLQKYKPDFVRRMLHKEGDKINHIEINTGE